MIAERMLLAFVVLFPVAVRLAIAALDRIPEAKP